MNKSQTNDGKVLLDIHEAAALLRIKKTRAYEMAASGQMPGVVRIGKLIRIHKPTLIEWLAGEAAAQPGTRG